MLTKVSERKKTTKHHILLFAWEISSSNWRKTHFHSCYVFKLNVAVNARSKWRCRNCHTSWLIINFSMHEIEKNELCMKKKKKILFLLCFEPPGSSGNDSFIIFFHKIWSFIQNEINIYVILNCIICKFHLCKCKWKCMLVHLALNYQPLKRVSF